MPEGSFLLKMPMGSSLVINALGLNRPWASSLFYIENQKNSISISVQDISIQNINNILEELNCGQLDSKQKKLYKKQD